MRRSSLLKRAEGVRREANIPVASSWCVDDPHVAEAAVQTGLGVDKPAWILPSPYAHWLSRYAGPVRVAAQ
jgi:hypothetical protein